MSVYIFSNIHYQVLTRQLLALYSSRKHIPVKGSPVKEEEQSMVEAVTSGAFYGPFVKLVVIESHDYRVSHSLPQVQSFAEVS